MPKKLLLPEQALAALARRFERGHLAWWAGDGADQPPPAWPLTLPLGAPTEADVARDAVGVRAWVQAWSAWPGPGEVLWENRQWARLGAQRLPAALLLALPEAVAILAGQGQRWQRASARRQALQAALPDAMRLPAGPRIFEALADWDDDDVERLTQLLAWVAAHPASGLYLRQLPVPGMDTKWIERRKALVAELATALWPEPAAAPRDLHALLGLSKPPVRLRLRLLCASLRRQLGGLGDIEAPAAELAALPLAPQRAIVVENLETGLALPELPSTVAFMKLGHAVGLLGQVRWLSLARVHYWGDLDSHGFAILDQMRRVLPQTHSLLMEQATLLAHRALWVEEPQPWTGGALDQLTAEEQAVFGGLMAHTWQPRVRLEQERIPWAVAEQRLRHLA
jgi:hypothetical protein